MPTYNDVKYLSLPQRVQKNQELIDRINANITGIGVGPQGLIGPQGAQGIQGNVGPAGPSATPLTSLVFNSEPTGLLGIEAHKANILRSSVGSATRQYQIKMNGIGNAANDHYFAYYLADGVTLAAKRISPLDLIILRWSLTETTWVIYFYDELGEATFVELNVGDQDLKICGHFSFTVNEFVSPGGFVGPTGPAGAIGPQGATGPQGAQGIQGLPGEQNMRFLAVYEHLDTFPEYDYRVMVQCIGGDYDGMTFIKETMNEGATCKVGPYATLVSIEDNAGTIQSELLNGVTSVRIYAIENLT